MFSQNSVVQESRREQSCHKRTEAAIASSGVSIKDGGRMTYWRGSVDAADAKKAEDASIRVLLIRKLPKRTGRLA